MVKFNQKFVKVVSIVSSRETQLHLGRLLLLLAWLRAWLLAWLLAWLRAWLLAWLLAYLTAWPPAWLLALSPTSF